MTAGRAAFDRMAAVSHLHKRLAKEFRDGGVSRRMDWMDVFSLSPSYLAGWFGDIIIFIFFSFDRRYIPT